MMPSGHLGAQEQAVGGWAGARAGEAPRLARAARRDDAQRLGEVVDVGGASVREVAAGPGGEPPPSVEWAKDWGKWRRVGGVRAELVLEVGSSTPAWMQAARLVRSISSTWSRRAEVDGDRSGHHVP